MTTLIGIDFSLNSPAICICPFNKGGVLVPNCTFVSYALTKKQLLIKHPQLQLIERREATGVERNARNANLVLDYARAADNLNGDLLIAIEGYAFGAHQSRQHDIAENVGVLKYVLLQNLNNQPEPIPPTVIKKIATSKGNATKTMMYEAWIKNGGFDLLKLFGTTNPEANPITDIVDSFFVAKAFSDQHPDRF